jgi:DNA-binding response OmpR family regulator
MRILVVEDDIDVASLLAAALTRDGHEVVTTHDAEEALAVLAHYQPDALLLDIVLGELSGIDLLRQLRKTDTTLPVVLLTGVTPSELEEARHLGVADIIEKPFALSRLPQVLREVSGLR